MKEFRVCPTCGYARGFHVSFTPSDELYKIIFICPDCGSAYDLDISVGGIPKDREPVKVSEHPEKEVH